jgi:hypothetical protein
MTCLLVHPCNDDEGEREIWTIWTQRRYDGTQFDMKSDFVKYGGKKSIW